MASVRVHRSNNGYKLIEPKGRLDDSLGYMMIVDSEGKVLRFYEYGSLNEATDYFKYISSSRWDKIKYWLNYKRKR